MSFNPQEDNQYKRALLEQLTALLPKKVDNDKDEIDTLPSALRPYGRHLRSLRVELGTSLEEKNKVPTFYDAYQTVMTVLIKSRAALPQKPEGAFITGIEKILSIDSFRMYCSNSQATRIVREQYVRFDKLRELKILANAKTQNTCAALKDLNEFHTRLTKAIAHFTKLHAQEDAHVASLVGDAKEQFVKLYEEGPNFFDLRDFEDTILSVLEKSIKDPELNEFSRGLMTIVNVKANLLLHLLSRAMRDLSVAQELVKSLMNEREKSLKELQEKVAEADAQAVVVKDLVAKVTELEKQASTAGQLGKVSIELEGKLTEARKELSDAVARPTFESLKELLGQEQEKFQEATAQLAKAEEIKLELEGRERLLREQMFQQAAEAEKERAEAERREAEARAKLAALEAKAAAQKSKLTARRAIIGDRDAAINAKNDQLKKLVAHNRQLVAENEELSEWVASASEVGGKDESEAGEKSAQGGKRLASNARNPQASSTARQKEIKDIEEKIKEELDVLRPFVSELRLAIISELKTFGDLLETRGKPSNSKQKFVGKIMLELLQHEGSTQSYFDNSKVWKAFRAETLITNAQYAFLIPGFKGVKACLAPDVKFRKSDEVGEVDKVKKWSVMAKVLSKTSKLLTWQDGGAIFSKLADDAKALGDKTNVDKQPQAAKTRVDGQAAVADVSTIEEQSQVASYGGPN